MFKNQLNNGVQQLHSVAHSFFHTSLQAMVKAIRAARDAGGPDEETRYIEHQLTSIREELRSNGMEWKAVAVQKLIYLHMMGYDVSKSAFHIVEVMSAPWFGHKRTGYLAAALVFGKGTDVVLLTTHLFRKAFTATKLEQQYEIGSALSSLSSIMTPDLAEALLSDVYNLLSSSKPYIRKRATLCMLNLYRQYPKAIRMSFDKLEERLSDEDPHVVSAAIYVMCELAIRNPKNYLALAPIMFDMLKSSTSNWMLIKVVKLLGTLMPHEPRLAKKLAEPLSEIITNTPAKSLLYECVNTMMNDELTKTQIKLVLSKLREFIEDSDQNLKYLGLLGLHKLMLAHPKIVSENKSLVLDCLNDEDITIRMRALDLITAMINTHDIQQIVAHLARHLEESDGHYRELVLERILIICSHENYVFITDFQWYLDVLLDFIHLLGVSRANVELINKQLLDIVIRVPAVRRHAVERCQDVLLHHNLHASNFMCEVLHAASFIVGEFAEYIVDHLPLVRQLLRPQNIELPPIIQTIELQSALKIVISALSQPYGLTAEQLNSLIVVDDDGDDDYHDQAGSATTLTDAVKPVEMSSTEQLDMQSRLTRKLRVLPVNRTLNQHRAFVDELLQVAYESLLQFTSKPHIEVLSRATVHRMWILYLRDQLCDSALPDDSWSDRLQQLSLYLSSLFQESLKPVHLRAQQKVHIPKGLDLNEVINPGWDIQSESDTETCSARHTKSRRRKVSQRSVATDSFVKKSSSNANAVSSCTPRESPSSPDIEGIPVHHLDDSDLEDTAVTDGNTARSMHPQLYLDDLNHPTSTQRSVLRVATRSTAQHPIKSYRVVRDAAMPSDADASDVELHPSDNDTVPIFAHEHAKRKQDKQKKQRGRHRSSRPAVDSSASTNGAHINVECVSDVAHRTDSGMHVRIPDRKNTNHVSSSFVKASESSNDREVLPEKRQHRHRQQHQQRDDSRFHTSSTAPADSTIERKKSSRKNRRHRQHPTHESDHSNDISTPVDPSPQQEPPSLIELFDPLSK